MIAAEEGTSVAYSGRLLYSSRSPEARANAVADNAALWPDSLILVPSPILFYGVKHLINRLSSGSYILCVELDQNLMKFSVRYAPTELLKHEKLSYIRSSSPTQVAHHVNRLGATRFRRVAMVLLSGGYSLYKSQYDDIRRTLERSIERRWRNQMTLMHMSRLWIANMIKNLSRNWSSLQTALPRTTLPVVVAGAGESLEYSLPYLRRNRRHFFLFAVDTALPVILESGLEPDATLVLESQIANAMDFINHGGKHLTCICDLTSHPAVLENLTCTCHFMLSTFADVSILARLKQAGICPPSLPALGSVGVAAVEIALRLTAAPIIITGLDFCYTCGKPHARGSPSHLLSLTRTTRRVPVGWYTRSFDRSPVRTTDLRGCRITSDPVLYSYGEVLAEMLHGKPGIYDMRRLGITLDIAHVDDVQLTKLLGEHQRHRWTKPDYSAIDQAPSRGKIAEFFSGEINLIDQASMSISRPGLASLSSEKRTELLGLLTKLDYVFVGFPDSHTWKNLDASFLMRFLASAAEYKERFLRGRELVTLQS